jgi:IS4 transposase
VRCKTIFRRATPRARRLGEGEWVRRNPLRALFVRVRQARKGRHRPNAFGKRARSKTSPQSARRAQEPGLGVACTPFAKARWSAKPIARLYRQRMQIEERFRDMKSPHLGEGLEGSRSPGVGRFTIWVLIASLAAFGLWLLGPAAEPRGIDKHLHPSTGKRRVYSRLVLARLLLVLEPYRNVLDQLGAASGQPAEWIANDHDALLDVRS